MRRRRPDLFFDCEPSAARAICRTCPVASPCAEFAIAHRLSFGIWGGTTGREREAIAKERGITWEPDPEPARAVCSCGRWARPQRTMCTACQQRAYRASRR